MKKSPWHSVKIWVHLTIPIPNPQFPHLSANGYNGAGMQLAAFAPIRGCAMQEQIAQEQIRAKVAVKHAAQKGVRSPLLCCPLCLAADLRFYHRDRQRAYWQCTCCALVFVPPEAHLDVAAEKARYDEHQNDPADARYRHFLARLVAPLLARLPKGAHGLDFGCGPGPALAQMFTEAGMRMRLYDPFYAPDATVWAQHYDFITTSEVAEHLYTPAQEFARLFAALKPGGWLGVMTKRVSTPAAFAKWHYIRDPTHVCFYSATTFRWIARRWQATLWLPTTDVALLQKQTDRVNCEW
jgi:hypothetical protein